MPTGVVKKDISVQNEVKTLRDRIESLERQLSQARANTPDSGKKAYYRADGRRKVVHCTYKAPSGPAHTCC